MPIYEFLCKCNKITEEEHSITNVLEETKCQHCGQIAKKIISLSTFKLKGDGWSNTSYQKIGYDFTKDEDFNPGTITKTPIIKDRKTDTVLSGPVLPGEKPYQPNS